LVLWCAPLILPSIEVRELCTFGRFENDGSPLS
jgi:hypothetical protein